MCFAFGFVRRCGSVAVLPLVCVRHCGSIAAFAFGSRLSFFLCQEKRDGLRCLAFLFRRVEIAIRAFSRCRCGYRACRERGAGLRGDAVLLRGFALGLRLPSRLCCRVCPRFTPALAALLSRLPSVHACLFSFVRKKETACGILRSCSAGSRSPSCVLAVSVRLSAFVGSLRVCAFLYGDLDGLPGCGGRGYGATGLAARPLCVFAQPHWRCCAFRGEYAGAARPKPAPKSLRLSGLSSRCGGVALVRVRGLCALLRSRIGVAALSAGSTLGLRAPDCAKESSTLWTLLRGWPSEKVRFTRRGCVGAYTRRRHPGTRKDPPGSNLWPGGSGCIAMLPTRSIVQTQAAPKRRGVGLRAR